MPRSILDITFDEELDLDLDIKTTEVLDPIEESKVIDIKPAQEHKISLDHITTCPRCNKPLVAAIAINGDTSVSFLECPACGTLINTYKPTYYQTAFLRHPARYKMTAGGYGSGKSRTDIEDVIKHLLLIPNARVCVAARTYPVIEGTFLKEFQSMFPMKLLKSKNETKHEYYFTNGSCLLLRSFDDETKLKSLNLTMAVIVEASDVTKAAFNMMQSRIRNTAAMIPAYNDDGSVVMRWDPNSKTYKIKYIVDVRHIDLETNPDSGWVKGDFLLDSETVEFYGDAYNEGYRFKTAPDPNKYSQVVSTSANPHLPENYEEEQTRDKSEAYIQQFFKGSFNFSTNLVFPHFGVCIKKPHALPPAFDDYGRRTLFFLIGADYGIGDPTHIVYMAFSTVTRILYVFDEMRVNNSDVATIAKEHRHHLRTNGTDLRGLLMLPQFDGRSYNKRESDLKTIGEMFEAEGLFFEPEFSGHEVRILMLNALINHNQIEIFSTCEFLIEEALNYKFKVDKEGKPTKKPKDGNDHGVTALEFAVVKLPHNLKEFNLKAFISPGVEYVHDKHFEAPKKKKIYDPLEEDTNDRYINRTYGSVVATRYGDGNRAYSIFDEEQSDTYANENANRDEDVASYGRSYGAYIPGKNRR